MTVALIASVQSFIGLSTDSKPSAPSVGSEFYETDTRISYVYDGSAWQRLTDRTLLHADLSGVGGIV